MAQYQTRASKLAKSSYRYVHKISATETELVDLPNGMTIEKPVTAWSRHCALYGTSLKSTQTIEGYNAKLDFQVAVKRIQNDPFMSFTFDTSAIIFLDNDTKTNYYIKNLERATDPFGYHVITLTTTAQS
ncbi:hypothetical protein PO181_00255 [Leuconostoc suionicum]|uniref:hypothetical protein n=1 Tax=Leuconostoc suionicum TaxID=1511761 RepID=UPI00233F469D|nr:hypothetical protein [Leuconostoc suionicum]MDC2815436.1 hypothetical protein [Leuconostoc suionicum]